MCNISEIECLLCWAFLHLQSPRAPYFHHPCHLVPSVVVEITTRGKEKILRLFESTSTLSLVRFKILLWQNYSSQGALSISAVQRFLGSIQEMHCNHIPLCHGLGMLFPNLSVPTETMHCFLALSLSSPSYWPEKTVGKTKGKDYRLR